MGHWNYCIVKYRDGSGYGLHEVYYDDKKLPWGMTEDAVRFMVGGDETPLDLISSLEMALEAAKEREVFEQPEEGKWPGRAP